MRHHGREPVVLVQDHRGSLLLEGEEQITDGRFVTLRTDIRRSRFDSPSATRSMCWAEMSASVQWVATRTERIPRDWACFRSCTVRMPGSSSGVGTA